MSAKADDSRARRPRGRERRRAKLPTPRASLACLAALVALLASCAAAQSDRRTHARDDTASHVAPAPSPTQTPSPAETPAASRTPAPDKDGGAGGTLFDYRREHAAPPPQLPASELRQVLRVVNAPRGRDTYEVNSVARGSFTEPRAAEVVYLLQPGGAAGAGPAGTKGALAVVFRGPRPPCQIPTGGSNFILRKSDLNGDGLDELLLESSAFNMGLGVTHARLAELKGCRLNLVRDFGTVDRESCGADAGREMVAGVIRYEPSGPGAWPKFVVEYHRAPCPETSGPRDPSTFRPAPDVKRLSP